MRRAIAVAAIVAALSVVSTESASAALPCSPVSVARESGEAKVRVAVSRIGCPVGREVVERFFTLYNEDLDNVVPEAIIDRFHCAGALAFTQLSCKRGRQRIFASSRPEDHPASWGGPVSSSPGGIQLTASEAARYMRRALGRRPALSFDAAYGRRIRCGRRNGERRRRCTMSWIVGDLFFSGRGRVRLTVNRRGVRWHFSYRIVRFNEYCAVVVEGDDCTKVLRAHGSGRPF